MFVRRVLINLGPTFLLMGAWAVPDDARACHDVRVCVYFDISETSDLSVGDHLVDPVVPARGLRVTIIPPSPEPPLGTYLDPDDGCIDLRTQYTYGLTMIVYPEVLLGQNDNVHIRAYDTAAWDVMTDTLDVTAEYELPVRIHGVADEDQVDIVLPPSKMASGLAYAAETIYRMDNVHGVSATEPRELKIAYMPAGRNIASAFHPKGSDVSPEHDEILLDVGLYADKKFVIAHEVGHWLHTRATADGLRGLDYEHFGIDDPCVFCTEPGASIEPGPCLVELDGVLRPLSEHALRSSEFSPAAVIEGYAHFVAAVAFNDLDAGGMFKYYKDLEDHEQYEDIDPAYLVSLGTAISGGVDAWVQNQCTNDFAFPLQMGGSHVSSEIDWLRVFWRFVSDDAYPVGSAGSPADVHAVVVAANDTGVSPLSWQPNAFESVLDAAEALLPAGQDDRLAALGEDLGVFNDGP